VTGVRPTRATRIAVELILLIIAASAAYLITRYPQLPSLLPVHFKANGAPDGWQWRTWTRVLLPVFVQAALAISLCGVGALLLTRPGGNRDADPGGGCDADAPDAKAAAAAAEAVVLIALVWVAFQGYAAWALLSMWTRGRQGLGLLYPYFELTGGVVTLIIAMRAHFRLGRPAPRPFVAEHWRYGHLYKNAADPALFVPTRDGSRWTLNFGRPVTAALLGLILAVGILGPTLILAIFLRGD
jgi:uncharacterized membrane protein